MISRISKGCPCGCHSGHTMGIVGICCQCRLSENPLTIAPAPNFVTPTQSEINVLRESFAKLDVRLREVEAWKKTAKILCDQSKKPYKCPVCEGRAMGCLSCEGKGIVWG